MENVSKLLLASMIGGHFYITTVDLYSSQNVFPSLIFSYNSSQSHIVDLPPFKFTDHCS
jgi:hypothetical protein